MPSDKSYATEQRLNALFGLAWQAYTPSWTGLTTLGSSVAAGRYWQVGKMVGFQAQLTWGAGSSLGGGAISFSLPVQAGASCLDIVGHGGMFDTARWVHMVWVVGASAAAGAVYMGGVQSVTSPAWVQERVPGFWGPNWASGAIMSMAGIYESV